MLIKNYVFVYLDEVDTLDEVETDDDVDTELEVEILPEKQILSNAHSFNTPCITNLTQLST